MSEIGNSLGIFYMIAPATESKFAGSAAADSPRKKRRAQQAVEVRVVVEVQMPAWMRQMHEQYSADPSRGRLQEADRVVPKYQDAHGSAVFVTSSEPVQPAPAVRTSSGDFRETFNGDLIPIAAETESLVELYDRLFEERHQEERLRPRSIQENRSRLRRFEAWVDTRIDTPRICALKTLETPGILKEYAKYLRSQSDGSSESMCSKAISTIRQVATACHELGLIRIVPKRPSNAFITQLKPKSAEDRRITSVPVRVDELRAMLAAVDGCQWPKLGKVNPAVFWEACLLSHYAYGFRSQDWFAVQDQWKQGLLWSGVITESKCPVLDDLHNENGWAMFVVHKTDTKDQVAGRTSDVAVPLSAKMRSLIESFRGVHPVRVFPLTSSGVSYRREFRQIRKRAGLSDKERLDSGKQIIRLSLGQKKIASFRKGSAAMWAKHGSKAVSSYILHHALQEERVSKTTTDNYLQSEEVLREMVSQIEQLPIW